eukprot:COSAG03_NODE_1910_length_3365_cov_19.062156_4_plen_185_part_00
MTVRRQETENSATVDRWSTTESSATVDRWGTTESSATVDRWGTTESSATAGRRYLQSTNGGDREQPGNQTAATGEDREETTCQDTVLLSRALSACLSVCLSVCLPACLSVCLSACLSVCLSVCLYLSVSLSFSVSLALRRCVGFLWQAVTQLEGPQTEAAAVEAPLMIAGRGLTEAEEGAEEDT